jgi:molecular chaperone DnaJ
MELTLKEALLGKEEEISFTKQGTCEACGGTGHKPGSEPQVCATCQGRGQVIRSQGFFQISTTCPSCHGEGRIITDPCLECTGTGQVRIERQINIKIPPGVDTGSQLRLRGEGEAGQFGGPPGDLFVVIHVREHEFFIREGAHLLCEVPASFVQVALGDTITIPSLEDEKKGHELKIPKGTQPGDVLTVPGGGMPGLRGSRRGDLYAKIIVKIPKKLNQRQKELLEEFASIEKGKASNLGKNLWKKLKSKAN